MSRSNASLDDWSPERNVVLVHMSRSPWWPAVRWSPDAAPPSVRRLFSQSSGTVHIYRFFQSLDYAVVKPSQTCEYSKENLDKLITPTQLKRKGLQRAIQHANDFLAGSWSFPIVVYTGASSKDSSPPKPPSAKTSSAKSTSTASKTTITNSRTKTTASKPSTKKTKREWHLTLYPMARDDMSWAAKQQLPDHKRQRLARTSDDAVQRRQRVQQKLALWTRGGY